MPSDAKGQKKPASKPAQAQATKPAKPKKDKPKAEAPAAEVAPPKPVEPAKPRPPADPRLKVLKKFQGRFLPKGPLRERLKGLMDRWNSGDDHGGVTHEELKGLLEDWRASRQKRAKVPKA